MEINQDPGLGDLANVVTQIVITLFNILLEHPVTNVNAQNVVVH